MECRRPSADVPVSSRIDGLFCLPRHDPKPGDSVFIPAGTVHTLGNDIVVFEVQQNSDVTFRLYDWGHVDAKTGKPRPLQVDQAFACIDFEGSAGGLVTPRLEATMPLSARDSLIANRSGCGDYSVKRPSQLEPQESHVCCCIGAQDSLNMPTFLMP